MSAWLYVGFAAGMVTDWIFVAVVYLAIRRHDRGKVD
jgi:hypothetical protein